MMHSNFKVKKPSNKFFGYTMSVILLIICAYAYVFHNNFLIILIVCSIFMMLISFFKPSYLGILNNLWFRIGILLGLIVSPIVMFLIYLITFFPIGFILRIFNKDLLLIKKNNSAKSYWIKYINDGNKSMKNQF